MISGKIAFIAGGGKYGSGALQYLLKQPNWKIVVCDENNDCQSSSLLRTKVKLEDMEHPIRIKNPTLILGNAVDAAVQFLADGIVPDTIIPCVPFHFAAKVLTSYLTNKGLKVQPDSKPLMRAFKKARIEGANYRLDERAALVLASKMPFGRLCAPGCEQPRVCPVTGRRLLKPMYQLVDETLNRAAVDKVKVFRSRLIAPNTGGYSGEELKRTLNLCMRLQPCTIAVATSCSCHAVANVFRIEG